MFDVRLLLVYCYYHHNKCTGGTSNLEIRLRLVLIIIINIIVIMTCTRW